MHCSDYRRPCETDEEFREMYRSLPLANQASLLACCMREPAVRDCCAHHRSLYDRAVAMRRALLPDR